MIDVRGVGWWVTGRMGGSVCIPGYTFDALSGFEVMCQQNIHTYIHHVLCESRDHVLWYR